MGRSIAETSVALTANAEKFVSEFRRADNESRRSAARIDAEVDKLTRNIKKKFSAADIGKDVLRGLGIGSGFAAAEAVAGLIAKHFEDAAKAAEAMAEASERSTKALLDTLKLRQSPEQQLQELIKEETRARAAYEATLRVPTSTGAVLFDESGQAMTPLSTTKYDAAAAEDAKAKWQEAANAVAEAKKKIDDADLERALNQAKLTGPDMKALHEVTPDQEVAAREAGQKALDDWEEEKQKAHEEAMQRREKDAKEAARLQIDTSKIASQVSEAMAKENDQIADLVQRYRDIADPAKAYRDELETISLLEKGHALSAGEAAKATEKIKLAMANLDPTFRRVSNLIETAGDAAADAWVQAANGVEGAWGNLGDFIIQEIERIVAKVLIVQPIFSALGMALSAMNFTSLGSAFTAAGTGHADGGRPDVGVPTWTGERGRELFVPDRPGRILTAGESAAAMAGGGGGGDTFVFAPQIAAGVTRQEFATMMPTMMKQFAAYVEDRAKRRT